MKLFTKIFLCCVLIFGIAFLVSGYMLISYSYENSISQEKKYALNQFQYNRYMVQSGMYTNPDLFHMDEHNPNNRADTVKKMADRLNAKVAFYDSDRKEIYTNLDVLPQASIFDDTENGAVTYQMLQQNGESSILSCGCVEQGKSKVYMVMATDISAIADNQKRMIQHFQKLYFVVLFFSLILIFVLSFLLTRPIKKVSRAAKRIAAGNYSERIPISGKDEIGELADNFNQMAEAVEEKIAELSKNAKQKEDFAANFAHELKTPLTSVIGYADMIYQKNMPREKVRDAAGYILNEGMRLEALSIKLMDLIVLNKQAFLLETISAKNVLENIAQGIKPLCKKRNVLFHMKADKGDIKVEFDLFKTMILNLADNAVKADSRDVWLIGKNCGKCYHILVIDNGKGIPAAELERVTEAFYMVDKSRSREQHGAGLGLALVSEIAKIHGATLQIESAETNKASDASGMDERNTSTGNTMGTKVTIALPMD